MNAKIYTGNIQPNPKEYKVWVNDEGVIKTWNGTEWIEQSGEESGGTASKYAPRYFKIDWTKCSENWKYIFSSNYEGKEDFFLAFRVTSTMKSNFEMETVITASQSYEPDSFSYNVLYIPNSIKNTLGINYNFCSFEQIIEVINKFSTENGFPLNLSMEGITEITEDEYYKIG